MAVLDNITRRGEVPQTVRERIDRAAREMRKDAPKRRLCKKFEKGETFWYLNEDGALRQQGLVTTVNGAGKPPHRIRLSHNFIRPIVEGKISTATQRTPSYEIIPTSTDFERVTGAKIAQKVAAFGYDKWRLRTVSQKTIKLALAGGGAGFAMPYFDPNVGPFMPVVNDRGEPEFVGQGEVKVLVLDGNQVGWEPGMDFEDSPWWIIQRARNVDEVKEIPGYIGGNLKPDSTDAELPDERPRDNLVLVTEYLERPTAKNPSGLRLTIANNRLLCPPEPYPMRGPDGQVLDEPCIHRLVYTQDPEADKDFGLVWQLIDPQRVAQDALNKASEWKNRCLNPQMIAEEGSLIEAPTDEPGAIRYYQKGTRNVPQWEPAQPIPDSLFRLYEVMQDIIRNIGADFEVNANPNVAAQTVQSVIEQSQSRWASFMGDVAEWHSRVMRHCLMLVANYYTEPRLLQIRGRTGFEPIADFKGADLFDQVDVVVLPGSLAYRTRDQIKQDVFAYADRGWISPEQAMAAIDGGTAENLIRSYELDVARANRIIQKIRDGSVFDMAPRTRTDPTTGMPMTDENGIPLEIPGYMPTEWDNLKVWRSVFGDWLKTEEYDRLDDGMQEVGKQIWEGVGQLEAEEQMRQMEAQNAMAAAQGLGNATRPTAKPMPSMPGGIPAPGGDGSSTPVR